MSLWGAASQWSIFLSTGTRPGLHPGRVPGHESPPAGVRKRPTAGGYSRPDDGISSCYVKRSVSTEVRDLHNSPPEEEKRPTLMPPDEEISICLNVERSVPLEG